MADQFRIIPYVVRSAGTDVPPEEVQAGINSLAQQTTIALNTLATQPVPPTGPAGGDLSGTYPNPTVSAIHATSGTESGVAITASTLDSTPVGSTTPSTGAFTTLTATTPIGIASGGTGSGTASGARTNLGLGTIATQNANSVAITGGTIDNTPIGQTTPAAVTATTLNSTGGALNGSIGATTPNTGSFTTLAASSTVSGTGFTTFLASPPPIGSTAANTGAFTTLSASSTVSGTGFTNLFASPPSIGNTAANTGAFTTLSSTGNFTPSQTNGIVGTTTNNNANAGSVGEFVTATGTAVSLTTTTPANITSISLTAGDWDVWGSVYFTPAGSTTQSQNLVGINTTSATFPAIPFYSIQTIPIAAGAPISLTAPAQRLSLSATTTVFLVAEAVFATSTETATGYISARRRR